MKNWSELEGSGQNEALLNELKGNLFEYLVGSLCARRLGIEPQFVRDFDGQNGGASKQTLLGYQQWLMKADPSLYRSLPQIAEQAVHYAASETDLLCEKKWKQIIVVGKSAGGMGNDSLAESDLLFIDDSGQKIGLSLKFVKRHAFVNTKSAGIRSFVAKYFTEFPGASHCQELLNKELDLSFARMLNELYALEDLEDCEAMVSTRSIDPAWIERGLPELPGQLRPEAKRIVHAHYHRLSEALKELLKGFFCEDRELFMTCLTPILGFGYSSIRQLNCFHDDSYKKANFHYETYESLKHSFESLEFVQGKLASGGSKAKSGFELEFFDRLLQIRMKPMNKFTVSGLKVNCSVKMKRQHDN